MLKTYFRDKEYSIRRDYREDDNSAAAESVTASGLHSWQENRDDLLDQLSEQIDDVFDLASVTDSSSDYNSDSASENNYVSPSDNNAQSPNNDVTGTSNINTVESNNNENPYHPQNTSDVVQTDYTSFDHLEE